MSARVFPRLSVFLAFFLAFALAASPVLADEIGKAKESVGKKEWTQALDLLQKVLEQTPASKEAAALAARVYGEGGLDDAFVVSEDAWHKVLEADAKDRDAHLGLGHLYLSKARLLASDPAAGSRVEAFFSDAANQFRAVLDATEGADEDAAVGLVEGHYLRGAFDKAIAAADEFLAKKPTSPKVNYWKGQSLYLKARDLVSKDPSSAEAKELFGKAKGAYESSVRGDPSSYDAWMQLAYAAQYVSDFDTARSAYERAMDLDPKSEFPVKGIASLYSTQPGKYLEAIERLAKEKPKNLPVRWYLGWTYLSGNRYDDAIRVLSSYVKEADRPDQALVYLGQAYEGKGEAGKAHESYEAALKVNPGNEQAAGGIERPLIEEMRKKGGAGLKAAQDLVDAYKPLLAMAPKNVYIRNNLGFVLRDAVTATGTRKGELTEVDSKALPLLKESVRVYDEATKIIGELRPEITMLPYATRYAYAQIISDTGLMFWFYPQVRDVDKAREYYERALELSGGAYRDACLNLIKLLLEKEEYEEAYRVATEGADMLANEKGLPDEGGRIHVSKIAKGLVESGKVKSD